MRKERKPAGSRQVAGGRKKPSPQSERLRQLQEMVDLLLQASLRGHLLPSERRVVKKYLQERKKIQAVKVEKDPGPRCPACRLPLADPGAERCPWCSVLLSELRLGKEQALASRRRRSKRSQA